jgi:hypothetical protein
MRRIRRRLTYANVMVTVLAFIILGGGSAMAAFVVSNNSQVAPNTIFGHNAPAGKNKNVVADSLTGADVKESTLGQVPSAANGARRIDYLGKKADSTTVSVLHLDEMTVEARCYPISAGNTVLDVSIASTNAATWNYGFDVSDGSSPTHPSADGGNIAANSTNLVFRINSADVGLAEGDLIYRNANRVVAMTLLAGVNGMSGGDGVCQLTGVAVPAPS